MAGTGLVAGRGSSESGRGDAALEPLAEEARSFAIPPARKIA